MEDKVKLAPDVHDIEHLHIDLMLVMFKISN